MIKKNGLKIIGKDNKEIKIMSWDELQCQFPYVGLTHLDDGSNQIKAFDHDSFDHFVNDNIFFVTKPSVHSGYVNIYKDHVADVMVADSVVYDSEELAIKARKDGIDYFTVAKIVWKA